MEVSVSSSFPNPETAPRARAAGKSAVCPWWLLPTFDNPLRRLIQNPYRILGEWVRPGHTVVDLGCGMGYFSIPMARMASPGGQVICIDVQQQMLDGLRRRAEKAGVLDTITMHRCEPGRLGIPEPADFVLAFWMLHEVPDQAAFLAEVQAHLKPTGRFLLVEPVGHVGGKAFQRSVELAELAGLVIVDQRAVVASRSALFATKSPAGSS
jgi:2-polyprenyl-3-methyl-5-hydroxy-6-metoxy-1,4-benzoquinol methylase